MTKYEKAAVEVIAKVIQREAEDIFERETQYYYDEEEELPNPVPDEYIKQAKDKLFKILDDLMNPPANWS